MRIESFRSIIILCLMMVTIFPVSADIIDPNFSSDRTTSSLIQHCYIIENENQYPEYTFGFAALPHPGGGFEALEDHPCYTDLYHLAMPRVCVMNRSRYSELAQNAKGYIHDPSLISSDYWAPTMAYGNGADTLISLTDVLTVTSLNSTRLVVKKSRAFFTYRDGHTEDVPDVTPAQTPGNSYTVTESGTSGIPQPTGKSPVETPSASFQYIILPLTAAGIIIAILVRRR